MSLYSNLTAKAIKFIGDNSPLILTAIGATGVAGTAYLTHKATAKSTLELNEAVVHPNGHEAVMQAKDLNTLDKFKLVWINYLPAVGAGTLSIAAVIGANRVSTARAAALAAGLTLVNGEYDEYKTKVREKLGINKEEKMQAEIASDRLKQNPFGSQIILAGEGKVLFYDMSTNQYFESTMQDIRAAELEIQKQVFHNKYATLSDWYLQVGLRRTNMSDDLGWNEKNPFKLQIITTEDDTGTRPVFAINFNKAPIRKFHRDDEDS